MRRSEWARGWLATFSCILIAAPAVAQSSDEFQALKRRIEELERQQDVQQEVIDEKTSTLAGEIERTRLGQVLPEKADLKSEWGLGPAASSVYNVKRGLSLAGYAELNYRNFVSDEGSNKDQADALRLVTYAGYKFSDSIIFNSEIEFEHGTTSGIGGTSGESEGSVSVEFAYLDFLLNRGVNARAGLLLIPMGFINEIHEPPYFHGVVRPEVEQVIIPTTWREMGAGLFGEFDAAGTLAYRTYLVNGLRASRFSEGGIRDSRQNGNRALFEDVAWTGRLDYAPAAVDGLLLGGSFFVGNSGQDEVFAEETPDVLTTLLSTHAQYRYGQLELRALGAWGSIEDADVVSAEVESTVPEDFSGWYAEAAYDVLPHFVSGTKQYLAPFFRYENLDTQEEVPSGFARNDSRERTVYTAGLTYKPLHNVALKLDYRNIETEGEDEAADEVALGLGFAF